MASLVLSLHIHPRLCSWDNLLLHFQKYQGVIECHDCSCWFSGCLELVPLIRSILLFAVNGPAQHILSIDSSFWIVTTKCCLCYMWWQWWSFLNCHIKCESNFSTLCNNHLHTPCAQIDEVWISFISMLVYYCGSTLAVACVQSLCTPHPHYCSDIGFMISCVEIQGILGCSIIIQNSYIYQIATLCYIW